MKHGYNWSIALLICSIVYISLFILKIVFIVMDKQMDFIPPTLQQRFSQSASVGCLELALSVAGMNSRRWKNRNTQPLFILGLIMSLIFISSQGVVPNGMSVSGIYDRIYAGLCTVNLVCLIGYSFSFRVPKKKAADA